jgi:hypothetical protein
MALMNRTALRSLAARPATKLAPVRPTLRRATPEGQDSAEGTITYAGQQYTPAEWEAAKVRLRARATTAQKSPEERLVCLLCVW